VDLAEAAKWNRKAAKQGNTSAQLALSFAYADGAGVARDQGESIRWLRQAAENGDAGAQNLLGLAYLIGDRLSRDPAEAARWFRQSAEAGHPSGQSSYGHCLLTGEGVAKNEIEAVQWFQKATDQGYVFGQYHLGICYAEGLGTPKDLDAARKWLKLAADQDCPDARYRLRRLFFQKHAILKWREAVISTLGYALLINHWLRAPVSINGLAIIAFLVVLAGSCLTFIAIMAGLEKLGVKGLDEREAHEQNERFFCGLKKDPWRFLLIPAEDGFFLVPLLYIGVNPTSAVVAALLFATVHYPAFPWRYCVPKGIAYFFVALFILPLGIWSVVVAHLFVDVALFVLMLLTRLEGKPTWGRLFRALRTE